MTVIRTTGLYHVVANDGPLPFWVEVRTYNRAPVVGDEVRVRGFATLERAERYMHKATRDAVKADKTLKRFVSSDAASSNTPKQSPTSTSLQGQGQVTRKRGRPAGSTAKVDRRLKENRPVTTEKHVPFSTARFHLVPEVSNPVSQVWVCHKEISKRGRSRTGGAFYPHDIRDYAVTYLLDGKLYVVVDDEDVPMIFPSWVVAEREALYMWDRAEEPKFSKEGTLYYKVGSIEVHLTKEPHTAFNLFDNKAREWVGTAGDRTSAPLSFVRLDTAIAEANAYANRPVETPAARLIAALWESEPDRMERELREARDEAARLRREAEETRLFEEEQAQLARIAAKNAEKIKLKGRRPATPEEIEQAKARKVTTKPTREQRVQSLRQMRHARYTPKITIDETEE